MHAMAIALLSLPLVAAMAMAYRLFWPRQLGHYDMTDLESINRFESNDWLSVVVARGTLSKWEYIRVLRRQSKAIDAEMQRRRQL